MIPEISHFALILAFCVALSQAVLPFIGAARGDREWMEYGRTAARLQGTLVLLSFLGLTACFYRNDFSLVYVASHSNSSLPLQYRLSATWGGHEGSILLWLAMLGLWSGAVAQFGTALPATLLARVLGVMGAIASGLLAFVLFTSNPFERLLPAVADGRDLNPLLQDPGMVIHPPLLYVGYVGFSVVFAFAVAGLLEGRFDAAWARWTRPWTLVAWCFLTLGIAMGSYWAYYELGWGGWWFWDPVENASFMPWLVGTALLHSLAVADRRNELKAWTLLLAIIAFSLSLLGTFLVRSGVLTSVHAFATDPRRGIFILVLLALVAGISLALFAWRAPLLAEKTRLSPLSREGMLLVNNVFLLVAAASVLLGTIYPLALDALGLGKISVGAPYFEAVFVPVMAPVLALTAVGGVAKWRHTAAGDLWRRLKWPLLVSLLAAACLPFLLGAWRPLTAFGVLLAAWLAAVSISELVVRVREARAAGKAVPAPATFGMLLAHLGLAMFIFGVTAVKSYEFGEEVRMAPGDTLNLGGYHFRFAQIEQIKGPNYVSSRADFEVDNGKRIWHLYPEKRFYTVQQMPMTDSAIDPGLTRDIYIALGELIEESGGVWGVRLQIKPFVDWIWIGCLLMAFGGFLAAADRRYRRARDMPVTAAIAGAPPGSGSLHSDNFKTTQPENRQ